MCSFNPIFRLFFQSQIYSLPSQSNFSFIFSILEWFFPLSIHFFLFLPNQIFFLSSLYQPQHIVTLRSQSFFLFSQSQFFFLSIPIIVSLNSNIFSLHSQPHIHCLPSKSQLFLFLIYWLKQLAYNHLLSSGFTFIIAIPFFSLFKRSQHFFLY